MAAFRSGAWIPNSGRRCRRVPVRRPCPADSGATARHIERSGPGAVLPRRWAPAGCGSTCRPGSPLVPAGRVRCTPPASVSTQARSQRVSVNVTLASSGPPGRLSAKHSVSSFPWQASTSVVPADRVDAVVAQDTPEAGRDVEIGIAPGVDDHGKLASGLAVEDRDQPLVGVPLNGAFGGDPFGAAFPAGAVRTVRDIKDHGIDRRTDAADCRPVRILRLRAAGRDKADQSSEDGSA